MSKVKTAAKNLNLFEMVYKTVKMVPEGKVATYGQIAEAIWKSQITTPKSQKRITPRIVGYALHANRDSKVPCHRVVNKEGRLAPNFAFNGWKEQKFRLEAEGVEFGDEMYVDLEKHLWEPK